MTAYPVRLSVSPARAPGNLDLSPRSIQPRSGLMKSVLSSGEYVTTWLSLGGGGGGVPLVTVSVSIATAPAVPVPPLPANGLALMT